MPKTFFIAGLPRSRTAWLANLLTYESSFCFHEAFLEFDTIKEYKDSLASLPYEYVGDSDCGASLVMDDLMKAFPDTKLVVIERDPKDCCESLLRHFPALGDKTEHVVHKTLEALSKAQASYQCLTVPYEKIDAMIEGVWGYLIPTIKFNQRRYKMLKGMNVTVELRGRFDEMTTDNLIVKEVSSWQL